MSRLRIEIDFDDVTLIRNVCRIYHTSLPTGLPQSCSPWRFSGVIFSTSDFSEGFWLTGSSQIWPFSTRISSSSPSRRLHCSSIVFGILSIYIRISLPRKYAGLFTPVFPLTPDYRKLPATSIARSPCSQVLRWSEIAPLLFSCWPSPPSLLFFRPKPRAPSPSASSFKTPRSSTDGHKTAAANACEPSSPARRTSPARFLQYFLWAG